MTAPTVLDTAAAGGPKPLTEGKQKQGVLIALWAFVVIPFLALLVAVPVAWGGWLSWSDVAVGLVFYMVSGVGVTVGFHRYLTHGSFKATRWLRVTLAVAGSMAIEGAPTQWVADHRRHHAFSDVEGDPHSPWRYGDDWKALSKGLVFAHVGWLFDPNKTSQEKFSPDLLADKGSTARRSPHPLPPKASPSCSHPPRPSARPCRRAW